MDERAIYAKTIMIWIAGGCSVVSLAFGIYSSFHNYPIVISITAIGAPRLDTPKNVHLENDRWEEEIKTAEAGCGFKMW